MNYNEEYLKCKNDKKYFINTYCYFNHYKNGSVLFKTYPYQDYLIDELNDNNFNIILKARQMGVSWMLAFDVLHTLLFDERHQSILYMGNNLQSAEAIITKIRFIHSNLPHFLQRNFIENNRRSIVFDNHNQLKAISATTTATRSHSSTYAIIEELAFIKDAENIIYSITPTLTYSYSKLVITSSPLNNKGWFHKMWIDSINGKNKFNPIKLTWMLNPEHLMNSKYYKNELGRKLFNIEMECEFINEEK